MQVSFIVITYQRDESLRQCLASIYQQTSCPSPYEIVIIDNDRQRYH